MMQKTKSLAWLPAFILAFTLIFAAAPPPAARAETGTYTDGVYNWNDIGGGSARIVGYIGPGGDVTIPDTLTSGVLTLTVTEIGQDLFGDSSGVTSVIIPASVSNIETQFISSALTTITVLEPNTNYSSEDGVLYNDNKTTLVRCPRAKGPFSLPSSVETIATNAFYYCPLNSITLNNGLKTISDSAFYECGLSSISIPDSVNNISPTAFDWAYNLTAINVGSGNVAYFSDAGVLYNKDKSTLILCPKAKASYVIPVSFNVLRIGERAFYSNGLSAIEIPVSVVSIGDAAFRHCDHLATVTLHGAAPGDGLETIGAEAFSDCDALNIITIPDSVTSIGANAFDYSGLESIQLSANLGSIADETFSSCDSLKGIDIPGSVHNIGEGAFAGCSVLGYEESVTLHEGLQSIGKRAFQSCYSMLALDIPSSVTSIGEEVFEGCGGLENITLPSGITSIPAYAFNGCMELENVTIPDGLTGIGVMAFGDCGLTSVNIPDSVSAIGDAAFNGCGSLRSATILNRAAIFGNDVFSDTALNTTPATDGIYGVDESTAEAYASANGHIFHPLYAVVFNTNGGSDIRNAYITPGNSVNEPTAPTLSGYVFGGWYADTAFHASVTFPYTPSGNVTLYVNWLKYTLTYTAGPNGSITGTTPQMVAEGGSGTQVTAVPASSYHFVRWSDGVLTASRTDTNVTGDIDVTAEFEKDPAITGLPPAYTMYKGGRVTWNPQPEGGVWDWDDDFFSATFNSPATFTALKAGTSTITYTVNGVPQSITVTIHEAELPVTGQDFTLAIWLLIAGVFTGVCAGCGFIVMRICRRGKKRA